MKFHIPPVHDMDASIFQKVLEISLFTEIGDRKSTMLEMSKQNTVTVPFSGGGMAEVAMMLGGASVGLNFLLAHWGISSMSMVWGWQTIVSRWWDVRRLRESCSLMPSERVASS